MHIVLDTNILVGACKGSYYANRLLVACLEGRFTPLVGVALLAEYEGVLARDEIFTDSNLSSDERDELLNALLSVSKWVKVFYLWRPNLKDEADNHLVELAVAGNARCIVSHNKKDFRQNELDFGIAIHTPQELLESVL
ncbi:toxin-antitoxin system toxin component, PIN family protein [Moraxella bovoculi]|uniref:Toxin-antitoxin system toxin component, PIN family protein n=1 Tax=Moraxella bovoculi TaxID=386891 RepID=A0AAC8PX81_9GAMM|nr:putative toxin-antitoxin system toxin component, PIN family [Moraxella bovoculi]AKG08401.1 toxin-antitoxin system toxin component, PIN family protein [Moraxella bovoculi]AKG09377.1 toxin-antitoxin system toxin component, PIN family protein [Moraxella bovoculi]AKG12262.1 toxin-antitoxin system toxin component, PIN family protein [Moraxella bovoculi]AKG13203.1 toxin-antitoxin system toxin component, PIN family protein [Moraxella bovoculi]AKG14233.1 toxin-antitoxin system toxin component, PIN 